LFFSSLKLNEKHYKVFFLIFLMYLKRGNRGQIWVETVIYTLIAFAMMGLVLAFAVPKIQEVQDKGVIEQSIEVLKEIDSIIQNLGGPGNQRVIDLGINKGTLTINSESNKLFFELESKYEYSQPGETVTVGKITANTESQGKINIVTLTLNYGGEYDIEYAGTESEKVLTKASVPYKLSIADRSPSISGNPIIRMEVVG
jgi:type II secretory pathway pseudopilin PulG